MFKNWLTRAKFAQPGAGWGGPRTTWRQSRVWVGPPLQGSSCLLKFDRAQPLQPFSVHSKTQALNSNSTILIPLDS
jgi:hypothetical protein